MGIRADVCKIRLRTKSPCCWHFVDLCSNRSIGKYIYSCRRRVESLRFCKSAPRPSDTCDDALFEGIRLDSRADMWAVNAASEANELQRRTRTEETRQRNCPSNIHRQTGNDTGLTRKGSSKYHGRASISRTTKKVIT